MPSLKLPGIVDVAVVHGVELLAFATLPYYQVSGNLLAAEGAVVIGDPIAYNGTKFVKYALTTVANEAVATGATGNLQRVFKLAQENVKQITDVKLDGGSALVEGQDYVVDYDNGVLFMTASVANVVALTCSYKWAARNCAGFVRIPGDSTGSADVPIEVVIGGAVKYSLISTKTGYTAQMLKDLRARYIIAADAVIF